MRNPDENPDHAEDTGLPWFLRETTNFSLAFIKSTLFFFLECLCKKILGDLDAFHLYQVRWLCAESVYLPRSVRIFRTILQLTTQGHHCAKVVIKNDLFLMKKTKQTREQLRMKLSVLNFNGLFSIREGKELLFSYNTRTEGVNSGIKGVTLVLGEGWF